MHIRNGCRRAVGDCWRKLGLISVSVILVGSLWGSRGAFLQICGFGMSFGPQDPCVRCCVHRKCLFSWAWANLLQDVGPLILVLAQKASDVYFSLCLSTVFTRMQTWLPVNNDSPKLVEMINIKVLILVWCLFWHRSLQELMVIFST